MPRLLRLLRDALSAMAFAALWAAAPAVADDIEQRSPRAVTVIKGSSPAARCVAAVAAGRADDATLGLCNRGLNERMSDRDRTEVLVNRGVALMRRKEIDPALADFDAALALQPDHPEAHLNRGAALVQARQFGQAVAALTESLTLGVSDPHKAYYNRGAAREALGDLRGALEDYGTALEIHPDWAPAEAEVARFVRSRRDHLAARLADDSAGSAQ